MRIVPIDQAAALSLKRPSVSSGIIPRGSYRGSPALPERDLPTAVVERFLVARADLDPNVVHSFTRALFEERSSLVAMNPLAGYISAPDIDGKLSLPLHAGARRYYDREKPNFWQQNARILAPTLYVIAILTSTLFAVRARILNRRKVRIGDYNLELMEIAEEAAQTQQPEELQRLKDRLVAMLRQLVQDLDGERVSQDEFEHFSFTWSAVDTLVRDRHTLGTSSGGSKGGGVEE